MRLGQLRLISSQVKVKSLLSQWHLFNLHSALALQSTGMIIYSRTGRLTGAPEPRR